MASLALTDSDEVLSLNDSNASGSTVYEEKVSTDVISLCLVVVYMYYHLTG